MTDVVRTVAGIRERVARARLAEGRTVGFVPTMGYLHEGHLSLLDRAREMADLVVVSIFVNPLQFGEGEDLADYPRDLERDVDSAGTRGADLIFAPPADEMYPAGEPVVTVDPGSMAEVLCGAYRPGHFRGVLTVVAKLFDIVRPDVAVFGRKDFQQVVLVERMVEDLNIAVRIERAPIVREGDGLAMSSRNEYLSSRERAQAPALRAGLEEAAERFRRGESAAEALVEAFRSKVAEQPDIRIQYAQVVNPRTLDPVGEAEDGSVLAVAAFLGRTRLIDNVELARAPGGVGGGS